MFPNVRCLAVQRRGVGEFRVDPRFKRNKGFLHYAFKTKAVIEKEETERMAAEWNEWDLQSLVTYKNLKTYNEQNKKDEVEAKRELRMKLRVYATDTFRGGMPRPFEMKLMNEHQSVPPIMLFDDHIKGQDVTTLDMRLMLKYISPETVPPPMQFLGGLLKANHVFDDESCGLFLTHCRRVLNKVAAHGFSDEGSMYKMIQDCWQVMREREGGHRCTMHQFAYSEYIKVAAVMKDMDTVLGMKQDLLDRNLHLNASVYEGILQCAIDIGRTDIALSEWKEMHQRYALAPTVECSHQMLRLCVDARDYNFARQIWSDMTEKYSQRPGLEVYNAMIKACAAAGETKQAFYHYYEMLEYTDLKPDLETCNGLLEACADLHDAEKVIRTLDTTVLESNDATFSLLFALCGKEGAFDALLEYWGKMQDQRIRPEVETLHSYLQALVEMPRNDEEYHPAELLSKGLAAYDWAGRRAIFNSKTFLLLLHLCAKAGQHHIAKVLFRKMVLNDIPLFPPHVAAMVAVAASSDSMFPLKDVEGLVALANTRFAATAHHHTGTTIAALHLLLTNRADRIRTEPDHAQRIDALWDSMATCIGEGAAREENLELLTALKSETVAQYIE